MSVPTEAADSCFQTDFTTVYNTLVADTQLVPHPTWTEVDPNASAGVLVTGAGPENPGYDPAYCAKDYVVTSICVGGNDKDCGTQFSVGGCAPIAAGVLVPNVTATRGNVYCYTGAGQADASGSTPDGSYPVGCPVNSVLVGFGTSGQNPTSSYDGVTYRNTAMCAPVGDAYVVDRGTPQIEYTNTAGTTLTCPTGTVATAFCKTSGGDAHCSGFDTNNKLSPSAPPVMGWLRCDTIRARPPGDEAPTFPPQTIVPDGGGSQPSTAACGTSRHAEVDLTSCTGASCGPTSKVSIGTYSGLLNEMYTTNTGSGKQYVSVRGDDTTHPASLYCGQGTNTCNVPTALMPQLTTCNNATPGGSFIPNRGLPWRAADGTVGTCADTIGCPTLDHKTVVTATQGFGATCFLHC
jgi:hypothetical protein